MSQTDEPKSWERRAGETDKAFAAFCLYRDLGRSRSIDKAWQAGVEQGRNRAKTGSSHWDDWAAKYQWVERVRAYDDHQSDIQRQQAEADHLARITAYRERSARIGSTTAEIAHSFLLAAGKRLQALTKGDPSRDEESISDIPIKALPGFLRAAASIAQISLSIEAEALGVRELEQRLTDAADQDSEEDSETGH